MTDAMTHSADDVAEAVKFHRPSENVRVAEDIVCRLWKDAQNAGSVGVSRWGMRKIHDAFAEILASHEAQAAEIARLYELGLSCLGRANDAEAALSEHKAVLAEVAAACRAMTEHYVTLAASGDCGFWDPEEEEQVIASRSALTRATALMEKDGIQVNSLGFDLCRGLLALAGAYVAAESVLNLSRQLVTVFLPESRKLLGEIRGDAARNGNEFIFFCLWRTAH